MVVVNNKVESFEKRLAQESSEEGSERKAEFEKEFKKILEEKLGSENIDFINTIGVYFERYGDKKNGKGDIELAINEAFKNVEGIEDYKDDVKELINYFKGGENIDNKNKQSVLDGAKYNSNYPIIERLLNDNIIDKKEVEELNKINNKDEFNDKVGQIIDKLSDEKLKTQLKKFIGKLDNDNEISKENFEESDFYKDFAGDVKTSPDKEDDLDILIANNYIKFPEKDEKNSINKLKNLDTSLDIVKNKIIEKGGNDFKMRNHEIIEKIEKTSNLGEKYALSKKLLIESKKEAGIKADFNKRSDLGKQEKQLETVNKGLRELIQKHLKMKSEKIKNETISSSQIGKMESFLSSLEGALERLKEKAIEKHTPGAENIIREAQDEIDKNIKNPSSFNEQKIETLLIRINQIIEN